MHLALTFKSRQPTLQQVDDSLSNQVRPEHANNQLRCADGSLYVKLKEASCLLRDVDRRKKHIDGAIEFVQGSTERSLRKLGLTHPKKSAKDLIDWFVTYDSKAKYKIMQVHHVREMRQVIAMVEALKMQFAGDDRFQIDRAFKHASEAVRKGHTWPRDGKRIAESLMPSRPLQEAWEPAICDDGSIRLAPSSQWQLKDPEDEQEDSPELLARGLETKSSQIPAGSVAPSLDPLPLGQRIDRLALAADAIDQVVRRGGSVSELKPLYEEYLECLTSFSALECFPLSEQLLSAKFLQQARSELEWAMAGGSIWPEPRRPEELAACQRVLQRIANRHSQVYGYPPAKVAYDSGLLDSRTCEQPAGTLRVSAHAQPRSRIFEDVARDLVSGLAGFYQRRVMALAPPADPLSRVMKVIIEHPLDADFLTQKVGVDPGLVGQALKLSPDRQHAKALGQAVHQAVVPTHVSRETMPGLYYRD